MTRRKGLNRWQKIIAIVMVVIPMLAVVYFLGQKIIPSGKPPVSTTPICLQQINKGRFCTGIAVKEVSRKGLSEFTATTRTFPAFVEYYQRFGQPFSKVNATQVALLGARPFIQINPHKVSITGIARGEYDVYLRSYAEHVKAFGHRIVLSFGHEMNGTWSTWSLPYTYPGQFVRAWRHIVKLFRHERVSNVTWAWDLSHVRPPHGKPYRLWYPGDNYVDWVGIDGYLRPGQTFDQQFMRVITDVHTFTHAKPILLTETAVAPSPTQAAQIHELFHSSRTNHLIGLIWFDVNKKQPWQLVRSNQAGLVAFRKEAQS